MAPRARTRTRTRTRQPSRDATRAEVAPASDVLAELRAAVSAFNRERRWKQFHAPKNLAMALAIEAAELMEPFRWMTPRESWRAARAEPVASALRDELADVLLIALSLADYLDLDLAAAVRAKLERNRARYPAELSRGRADKYTAYETQSARTKPGDGAQTAKVRAKRSRPRGRS